MTDTPLRDNLGLAGQLHRAWQHGYAVMLSPVVTGKATWTGEVGVYVYGPSPHIEETEGGQIRIVPDEHRGDWCGDPAESLRKLLDHVLGEGQPCP